MSLEATIRKHEGALLALVGAGVAGIIVVGKLQAASAAATTAASAPAIPADVLPVSGAGAGGGGPSGSVDASTAATPASSSTPAIAGNPATGTSGGAPTTSSGGDYQAPAGGTAGTSSQVPGSAGGSANAMPGTPADITLDGVSGLPPVSGPNTVLSWHLQALALAQQKGVMPGQAFTPEENAAIGAYIAKQQVQQNISDATNSGDAAALARARAQYAALGS